VVGRITIEDVLEVVREEADHTMLTSAGLDEEHDLFAPVLVSAKRRAVWLGVNLFTATTIDQTTPFTAPTANSLKRKDMAFDELI
jgi:Mg/Co/Ni transporter MgtE